MANVTKEAAAACQGEPRLCVVIPSSSRACVSSASSGSCITSLTISVATAGSIPRFTYMPRELRRLALGAVAERPALHLELALHQLALGRHGEVLAGRHGEGARDEAGHAGQAHDRRPRVGTGHAQDQGDVGDQAVADPEDGRPGAATPDVPVVVVRARSRARARSSPGQRSEVPQDG